MVDDGKRKLFTKVMHKSQAKQLLKLFDANMTKMINGVVKINADLQVDFTFIDKILTHMVGIEKEKLLDALKTTDISEAYSKAL